VLRMRACHAACFARPTSNAPPLRANQRQPMRPTQPAPQRPPPALRQFWLAWLVEMLVRPPLADSLRSQSVDLEARNRRSVPPFRTLVAARGCCRPCFAVSWLRRMVLVIRRPSALPRQSPARTAPPSLVVGTQLSAGLGLPARASKRSASSYVGRPPRTTCHRPATPRPGSRTQPNPRCASM